MTDPICCFTEKQENKVTQKGLQISEGMKSQLLTDRGKGADALLEEFTAEEQAVINDAYGIISKKLLTKSDANFSATVEQIKAERAENVEVAPAKE